MAEPIKISELNTVGDLSASALLVIVQEQTGELVSLKCSLSEVSALLNNGLEYADLATEDKTIIGAINELKERLDALEG